MLPRLYILLAALAAVSLSAQPATTPASDLATIAARLAAHYAAAAPSASDLSIDQLLADLGPDGKWPDLERDSASQRAEQRFLHYRRVVKLAGAFHESADATARARLAAAIHRALGATWNLPTPIPSLWPYLIGAPGALARVAILFEPELTAAERALIIEVLPTCVQPDGELQYASAIATGANLMDEAEIQIVLGVMTNNPVYVARYARRAEQEIDPSAFESIQVDQSFHQHGNMLYSGGYGGGFARNASALADALHGTVFAFSAPKVTALLDYVLDGLQPMTRGAHFDFATVGRQIARPDLGGPTAHARAALESLAPLAGPRRDEVLAFAARLDGKAAPDTAPTGTHVFWSSDYFTHLRPGFFASVRMSSRRIQGTESGNGENELGYHLGDGAMTLMIRGDEYHDIFPLWNWRRVPGVSNVDNPAAPFPLHRWGRGSEGFSDFAGGVSDGQAGIAAMELNRGGLFAHKAWFFLPDAVVCLGADLLPHNPDLPIVTTVNQTWARGPVTSSAATTSLTPGTTLALDAPGWVHHDGVTYLFPAGGPVRARVDHRSAPWSVINRSPTRLALQKPGETGPVVEGDVFTLWFEHGASVYHATSYAYIVAPGLAPADISAFEKSGPKILENTASLQAVAAGDLVQIAFWKPGALTLPDGLRIAVDQPSLIQLRRPQNNAPWTLAAGNPTQRVGEITITLTIASHSKTTTFAFPDSPFAGQPQTQTVALP